LAYVHIDDASPCDVEASMRENSASFSPSLPKPKMPVIPVSTV
jgi:hypothetical protein